MADRKDRRYHCLPGQATVQLPGNTHSSSATVLNVSRSGLRVETQTPFRVGQQAVLRISKMRMVVIVRRCRPLSPDTYEVGFEIENSEAQCA